MTKPKVFLTRKWPLKAEEALSKIFEVTFNKTDSPLTKEEIANGFYNLDALAPTVSDIIDDYIIEKGSKGKGKIIANFGVGTNHIDLNSCKKNNVLVTNTPDVLTNATADLTILLMLMVSRRTREGESELRSGLWKGWSPTHLMGSQMSDKVLGIIGMGRIGQAVARRACLGFNMKIIFFNRSKLSKKLGFQSKQVNSLKELCENSDYISLHCPSNKETKNIIDSQSIKNMKKDAILINTARGDIIDEVALSIALKNKFIGGAGLDVFSQEPKINPKLKDAPNTVFLPHLGSATLETRNAMGFKVLENLKFFFHNSPPPDLVI